VFIDHLISVQRRIPKRAVEISLETTKKTKLVR